jgi:plasmid replication initiation protein
MQTVRVPVGRVPQIKHTCEGRKIPFIKNACNNLMKKKLKRIQKTEIKVNEVPEIN